MLSNSNTNKVSELGENVGVRRQLSGLGPRCSLPDIGGVDAKNLHNWTRGPQRPPKRFHGRVKQVGGGSAGSSGEFEECCL